METGQKIRFRMAYYNHELEIKEESNEIKEGTIIRVMLRGVEVKVYEPEDKKNHNYFIKHDRILKARKGKEY